MFSCCVPSGLLGKALSFIRALIILGMKLLMSNQRRATGHGLTFAPGDTVHPAPTVYFNAAGRLENCKTGIEREREVKRKLERERDNLRRCLQILIRLNKEPSTSTQF